MNSDLHTGEVIDYDAHVGLGTVRSIDGDEHLFHCTQIVDGSRQIAVGTRVSYVVVPRHKGTYEAYSLTPVG